MHAVVARRFTPKDAAALAELFATARNDASADHYRPHPFTAEQASLFASHNGRDAFLGVWQSTRLVGYGMLRGWDAGFATPSLGIYIAPDARGRGISRVLMDALHAHATAEGATQVRLRVAPDNDKARRLYESLGYVFDGTLERDELVGVKALV